MIVVVASKNPVKIASVRNVLNSADFRARAHAFPRFGPPGTIDVVGVPVSSGVSEQPFSLEETVQGATNRAWRALAQSPQGTKFAFGIESGVFYSSAGANGPSVLLDLTACVIVQDGVAPPVVGFSSAWQVPHDVATIMARDKVTMDEAARRAGHTTEEKIGQTIGLVGVLWHELITRQSLAEQSVIAAMISMKQ